MGNDEDALVCSLRRALVTALAEQNVSISEHVDLANTFVDVTVLNVFPERVVEFTPPPYFQDGRIAYTHRPPVDEFGVPRTRVSTKPVASGSKDARAAPRRGDCS